jgi:predicted hotdog family 3-hydroxylacyl-ACP dehydratase
MSAAIETLIPHRTPMRFIDTLASCTDEVMIGTACFAEKPFAVIDGKVTEAALVECVAQTVAAALGHRAQANGKSGAPPNGMLLSASNFKIQFCPLMAKTLQIEVREKKRLGPMLLVAATISCDGEIVASGELSLYA